MSGLFAVFVTIEKELNEMPIIHPDAEYRLRLLNKELDHALLQIPVYETGIAEEESELELQLFFKKDLIHSLNFLRSEKHIIVSMHEYAKVRTELREIDKVVSVKRSIIFNLKKSLKDKHKEIDSIKFAIEKVTADGERGRVVEFRGKK